MLENLFLTIAVEKSYYSNLILYWLMKLPFFKQYTNYTSSPKTARNNLNIYFLIFIVAAPFFLAFCLIYLTAHNVISNLTLNIHEISYYYIGIFCGSTFFLSFLSNSIFSINVPKIYCFNFLKMNKNESTKSYFIFYLIKKFIVYGFITLSCITEYILPKYTVIMLPLFIVFMKIISSAFELYVYDKKKVILYNSMAFKIPMILLAILFGIALPKMGIYITTPILLITSPLYLLLSYFGLRYILKFDYNKIYSDVLTNEYILYRLSNSASILNTNLNKKLTEDEKIETYNKYSSRTLNIENINNINDAASKASTISSTKSVSEKSNLHSSFDEKDSKELKKSKDNSNVRFDLNKTTTFKNPIKDITNLFFERYSSVITKRIKTPSLLLIELFAVLFCVSTFKAIDMSSDIKSFVLSGYTIIPFILFMANATKKITKLMFYNCDASLLTYKFYKNSKTTFSIFLLRFKKCLLYNLIPSAILFAAWTIIGCVNSIYDIQFYCMIGIMILSLTIAYTMFFLAYYYLAKPYDYSSKGQSILTWIISIALFVLTIGLLDYTFDLFIFFDVIVLITIWLVPICYVLVKYLSKYTFKADVNN